MKSALLLAGLYAEDETSITEPAPTVIILSECFRALDMR